MHGPREKQTDTHTHASVQAALMTEVEVTPCENHKLDVVESDLERTAAMIQSFRSDTICARMHALTRMHAHPPAHTRTHPHTPTHTNARTSARARTHARTQPQARTHARTIAATG